MKIRFAMAAVAVAGLMALTYGSSMAGPGCCPKGKATKASAACTDSKAKVSQTGGGCASKGVGAAGCIGKDASACTGTKTSACTTTPAECEKMLRAHFQKHGWLGIEVEVPEQANAMPVVTKVVSGSPAHAAGLKAGDLLTSVNGVSYGLGNETAIQDMMSNGFKVGDAVRYTVRRDAQIVSVDAKLVRIPDSVLAEMIASHKAAHTSGDRAENRN